MRGIVMDIKDGNAVIFRENGDITKIKDRGYQIGQTVNTASYSHKSLIAAAACFVLFFIAGLSGYAAYNTPSGYIYLDINPSIRLDINCFDRVISVLPLNEDAELLMNSCRLDRGDAERCIDEIVFACREKEYLNEHNNSIEFSVVTDKSNLSSRIYTVSERLKKDNWAVTVHSVDKEENKKAMKYRTSPERLRAVEAYTNAFGGTLEDNFAALKGSGNREIYALLASDNAQTSGGKYKSSPERLKAVKEYTDMFGGGLEENMSALKGISTEEIRAAIESRTPCR